jgi:hypothetical protein
MQNLILPTHDIIKKSRQPYPARYLSIGCRQKEYAHAPYSLPTLNIISVLNRNTLGHVVDLVDANKARSQFELSLN